MGGTYKNNLIAEIVYKRPEGLDGFIWIEALFMASVYTIFTKFMLKAMDQLEHVTKFLSKFV